MGDDRWEIEGEFRDGSHRVRDEQGQYKSLSVAILEETSEIWSFDEDELAEKFGVKRWIILEHLEHLKEKGLIEGHEGEWQKPTDFDIGRSEMYLTEEEEWADHDDESLY